MDLSVEISGAKQTKSSMRLIEGRITKPSKPLMEEIGKRMAAEASGNIVSQNLVKTGRLRDSITVTKNTGRQVKVGPKGGLEILKAKVFQFGARYPKRGKRKSSKSGLRIKPRRWSYVEDRTVDWAKDRIADFVFGQEIG